MSQTPVRSDAPVTVTTLTPMVVTGSPGDRPFPEAAPEVDRSGKAPSSARGQRLHGDLLTMRLNLVQSYEVAVRRGDTAAAAAQANNIVLVDNAIDALNGPGSVSGVEAAVARQKASIERSIRDQAEAGHPADRPAEPTPSAPSVPAPAPTAPSRGIPAPAAGVGAVSSPSTRLENDYASLRRMGFDVGTPSSPNPEGIRAFQTMYNEATFSSIAVDGRLGPETRAALRAFVSDIQTGLGQGNIEGLDPGPVDGVWGSRTHAAFERYRRYQREGDGSPEHKAFFVANGTVNVHEAQVLLLISGRDGRPAS